MRLETIHEGKAITLTKEAHEFAMEYTVNAWNRYKNWESKIASREITQVDSRLLGNESFSRTIELHPKYRPGPTKVVVLTEYLFQASTEGHYAPVLGDVIEIIIDIGCANPKLSDMYIYETLIHEMTHAVDPKLMKQVEGSRWQYDVNKIRAGEIQNRKKEYMHYARQPVEAEAHTWQVANRFVRFFKEKGLKKAQIIDKARNFTPDILGEVYGKHAYGWVSEIYLNNKAYRRKLINTIINITNDLLEADMSRRQFLKTMGKGAMAAAAPKSALKGLMGGAEKTATSVMGAIPKTPSAMKAALIKWMEDNDLEQRWLKYYKEDMERNELTKEGFEKAMAQRKAAGGKYYKGSYEDYLKDLANDYVDTFRSELLSLAEPSYDEPAYLEDLQHVLDTYDNERFTDGMPIPEWVTRYRVSQFMGRDVGMDHPFVIDREQWLKHFHTGVYNVPDPKVEEQFINIIKTSTSPDRYKDLFGTDDPKPTVPEKDKPKPEEPKRIDSDEPDSWRTQSVEFEYKLVDRLRRL